jgi:hypothetical protein
MLRPEAPRRRVWTQLALSLVLLHCPPFALQLLSQLACVSAYQLSLEASLSVY